MKKLMLISTIFFVAMSVTYAASGGYHLIEKIDVGGQGGWDLLTVDDAGRRVFISHETQVEVIDLQSKKAIATIPNTPGVHGIALAPEEGRGFVTNGRASTVTIFDLKTPCGHRAGAYGHEA